MILRCLVALFLVSVIHCLDLDVINGVCLNNASVHFEPGLRTCVSCPPHSTAVGEECVCLEGFARQFSSVNSFLCTPCGPGFAVSTIRNTDGSQSCVPCGGKSSLLSLGVVNSSYDASSNRCSCPSGYVIAENIGAVALEAQMCVPCTAALCRHCVFPYVPGTGSTCVCSEGYVKLVDGKCVLSSQLNQLFGAGSGAPLTITPRNVANTGTSGSPVTSWIVNNYLSSALYNCALGEQTSCNLLANLCVLSNYDVSSSPCSLYRTLQLKETCKSLQCEIPTTLPWLYYLRSSADTLQEDSALAVSLNEDLQFLVAMYAWNGTWLGNKRLVGQVDLCSLPAPEIIELYRTGANRRSTCFVNIRWLAVAPQTVFYELFIVRKSDNKLLPVPVLLDYSNGDLHPENIFDRSIYRDAASSDLTPNAQGYRRRFFLYDNVGGIPVGSSKQLPEFVTLARSITLLMTIRKGSSSIYTPLLVVQYQSFMTTQLFSQSDLSRSSSLILNPTNSSPGDGTADFSFRSTTTMDNGTMENALMTVLIIVTCLSFFSAWIRTYGWMRRQQSLMLGMDGLVRFVLYLLNHVANSYALVVLITCWYLFVTYKYQYAIESAVPERSPYLFAMLYTAIACKGVVMIVKIVEQTNADVFLIDWERSKGQLLRENKMAPVSLWRSAFVINELNELQVLRRWRPLLSLLIIVLFLDGLSYIRVASNVPQATTALDLTADTNNILRIAVCSFFWVVVCAVLHILEFQIYYRFVNVHPLQAFVDLCSVSNVSVVILLEPQWGYYIHGESIHAHSDVSFEEFQMNLDLETQGNLPTRGLGGQALCQTFEVFLGTYMRQYLYMCYSQLTQEYLLATSGAMGRPHVGHHRRVFEFLFGMPGKNRLCTPNTLHIKSSINNAFQQSVRAAEKSLLPKFGLHALLDFPPNVLFMNGPFAGEGSGKDLFFLDDPESYGGALMYGLDLDLCLLYLLLFVAIDGSLHNVYASMVITYVVDIIFTWYRYYEGTANLGSKTLLDDRFFV